VKSPRLFLGVDGGQSSTTALIGDEQGSVLGVGAGGPCNHVGAAEGPEKLKRTVLDCLSRACEQAGLDVDNISFQSACFGMSGGPADKQTLLAEVLRTDKLLVTDDAVIALSGALGGEPGVVTIAGTGSIAFGRAADGRSARAGGWGFVFGDEGGAFDIVRQALRAALRYEEGWGPKTLLKAALLDHAGAANANALLHSFYTTDWPRARIAAMAPIVTQLADAGDPVALGILDQSAQNLASFALAVYSQLWQSGNAVRFSFVGGVFQSKLLVEGFRSKIESQPGCQTLAPLLGSAAGALLEAYRAVSISPDLSKLLTSNF
jgi:N-acetylglucosamine kinase-like BadF-type ATPase